MKSILYVGATLMIGASIYGFVDYKKKIQTNEFKKMYAAKKVADPEEARNKTKDFIVKKDPVNKKGVAQVNSFAKEFITPVKKIEPESAILNSSTVKENSTEKKYNNAKKKKLSYKLFSRAPLDEKYITRKMKPEPQKPINEEQ